MCTPSLAIDAIIEVHDQQFGSGGVSSYQKEQRYSARECLALRGVGEDAGLPHSNFLTTKSAADVRLAANSALRNSGRMLQNGYRVISSNFSELLNQLPCGTRTTGRSLRGVRAGKRSGKVKSSSHGSAQRYSRSNSTNEVDEIFSKGSNSSNAHGSKSNIKLVLVFRRDPPAGYALPGGQLLPRCRLIKHNIISSLLIIKSTLFRLCGGGRNCRACNRAGSARRNELEASKVHFTLTYLVMRIAIDNQFFLP